MGEVPGVYRYPIQPLGRLCSPGSGFGVVTPEQPCLHWCLLGTMPGHNCVWTPSVSFCIFVDLFTVSKLKLYFNRVAHSVQRLVSIGALHFKNISI